MFSLFRTLPGFNVANLSLSANIPVPQVLTNDIKVLEASLNINNVFGNRYNVNGYVTGGGYFGTNYAGTNTADTILVQPGAPRQFIAALTAKF